jgi:hypothetical protein
MQLQHVTRSQDGVIPWPRRWVRHGHRQPVDHAGFLVTNAFGLLGSDTAAEALLTLEDVADVPCVVALGEPGLGKSTALQAFIDWLAAHRESKQVLRLDLAVISSREELLDRVFRCADVAEWLASTYVLHLVLDSLDECPVPLEPLCATLVDELGRLPLARLRFVLACRTAVLPVGLVYGLRHAFTAGREPAAVYQAAVPDSDALGATGTPAGAGSGGIDNGSVAPREASASGESKLPTVGATNGRRATPTDERAGVSDSDDVCVALELAVLSREDVREASASALGGHDAADVFLAAVIDSGVGHFAAARSR